MTKGNIYRRKSRRTRRKLRRTRRKSRRTRRSRRKRGGCSGVLAAACLLKKKHHRGGAVSLHFEKPKVSANTSRQAIQTSIHQQNTANEEVDALNKTMAGGGGVVVPQMNQAGTEGNDTITRTVDGGLQSRADGEFDAEVYQGESAIKEGSGFRLDGGGKRRRRRRRRRTRKRKHKRKRKTKRCSKCPYRCCACCKCRKSRKKKQCRCRKCPKKCCPCCCCKRNHRKRTSRR